LIGGLRVRNGMSKTIPFLIGSEPVVAHSQTHTIKNQKNEVNSAQPQTKFVSEGCPAQQLNNHQSKTKSCLWLIIV
jgi:hypothetical protein